MGGGRQTQDKAIAQNIEKFNYVFYCLDLHLNSFKTVILRRAKMIQPQPIDLASLLQRAPFLTVQLKHKES